MKRYVWLAILLLVLSGCGGGSDSGSASSAQISGLRVFAPSSLPITSRNLGCTSSDAFYVNPLGRDGDLLDSLLNGAIIDFTAPEGNVASYSLAIYDAIGHQVFSQQGPVLNITAMTNGRIDISIPCTNLLVAGNYSCQVTITDTSGHLSNTLNINFTVS